MTIIGPDSSRDARRAVFDRGEPETAGWIVEEWADDTTAATAHRYAALLAVGYAVRPIDSWEPIAAACDETTWERILGDLAPRSRAEALKARPCAAYSGHLTVVPP